MRVEFTMDFDLSENQKEELIKNPLKFLYNHIDVKGIDKNSYNVVNVVCRDIMPYKAYGFSNRMVDWLNRLQIYRIEKICKFTYLQVKATQVKGIINSFNFYQDSDFLPELIEIMRERGLNFADINIDDLISINDMNISTRIKSSLAYRGIHYLQDVPLFTQEQVASTNGFGVSSKNEFEEAIKKYGVWYKESDKETDNKCTKSSDEYFNDCSETVDYIISNDSKLSYGAFGLSKNMIDWLNILGIGSINYLEKVRYEDFRLTCDKKNKNSFKYIDMNDIEILIEKMKENNVDFKDVKADSFLPILNCDFPVRTENCLQRFGICYLQDIAIFPRSRISCIRNLSKNCLKEIDIIMEENSMLYKEE